MEGIIIFAIFVVICIGVYVGIAKNLNKAGIGSYTVVVHFSEEDRRILEEIRDQMKRVEMR
jgi:hypothetical protein